MQQKLRSMIAEHRAKVKADPHVSGKRTGDSDDLWQAMCDMVQDIDEALAAKGEGDAAAVAEEARKNLRAEKVRLLVFGDPTKVEFSRRWLNCGWLCSEIGFLSFAVG